MRARADELKQVLTDNISIEDLVLVNADLKAIDSGFIDSGIETPEWVIDKILLIKIEIGSRSRAELQRRLKEAKARESALETQGEKRKRAKEEIKILEEKLEA